MKKVSISIPTTTEPEGLPTGNNEPTGLCSSCKEFQSCTYPRDPTRPVLQCEEFDGLAPPHPEMAAQENASLGTRQQAPPSVDIDASGSKGLCSICENRATCTYPKPEGGVWHCEEYQ